MEILIEVEEALIIEVTQVVGLLILPVAVLEDLVASEEGSLVSVEEEIQWIVLVM